MYKIKQKINKHFFTTLLLFIFCFLAQQIIAQSISGLNPQKNLSQYILKNWNTEDGLTSESTNDLIQTQDGYIWIGTYTGLHRFDGTNFTVYTSENSPLPSSNILRMDIDSKGSLWLGTLHGVCVYNGGKIFIPKALKEVKDFSIETIRTTTKGDVWFSTKSNHLFLYSKNKLINLTDTFDVNKSIVLTIAESPEGIIYLGTDKSQLFYYFNNEIREFIFDEKVNGINKIIANKEKVYIGTNKGLYTLEDNKLSKQNILTNTTINSLIEDKNGSLWMGTMTGLYRYQPITQRLDLLNEDNGLPNNIIRDLLFDHDENLWAGTYRNGFFFLSDGLFTSFTKNEGLSSNIITGITQTATNNYLLGDEMGKLNILKDGVFTTYNPEIEIPKARLKNMFTDDKKRIWISTYGGLVLLDGKKSRLYNIDNGFPDSFIRQVYQDHNGDIWVGTKHAGLIKFIDLDNWVIFNTEKGLSSNYIMSIVENDLNQLIVGTMSGINIIEHMKVIRIITVEDGLPSNFSFSTFPTKKYLWIASNDGLTGYSQKRTVVFNIKRGMPFNIIYNIVGDKKGNLWMPGEKAILKISLKDLEKAAEDDKSQIEFIQYNKSHGMKNKHCLGGVHTYIDNMGRFLIPTQGGAVFIDPNNTFEDKLNATLIIEGVYANNSLLELSEEVKVPSGSSRMSIKFTGISYQNIDNLMFRYKLTPFDKEWVHPNNTRNAVYTNLSPGQYKFMLQVGINGNFLEEVKEQIIIIESAWWQKAWFKILFVFFILFFGVGLYFLRVRAFALQKRKLENLVQARTSEIEKQKQELSNALNNLAKAQEQVIHSEKMASLGVLSSGVAHEMNNPLNFIQGGLLGLEDFFNETNNKTPDNIQTFLNAIKEGVQRATNIVSSLNEFSHQGKSTKEKCNIHNIIDNCLIVLQNEIKTKAKLIQNNDSEELVVLGNNGKLHQAVFNIISNGLQAIEKEGTLTINTKRKKKQCIIEIIDNGSGIEPENIKKVMEPFYTTKEPGVGTGLGLSITYNIIKEHKGKLEFLSVVGEGTKATITLPNLDENEF